MHESFKINKIVTKVIFFILLFIFIFLINGEYANAAYMYVEDGNICWSSDGRVGSGVKYYTYGYEFKVYKNDEEIYKGDFWESIGEYTSKETIWYDDDGVKWDHEDYTMDLDYLGTWAGISMHEGSLRVVANPIDMVFYWDYDEAGNAYRHVIADNLRSHEEVYDAYVTDDGYHIINNVDDYDVTVDWATRYLTVNKGTGVESTSGEGWYERNTTANWGGTAATGYHDATSGSEWMNDNKTVTSTASPNQYTVTYDANGGYWRGHTETTWDDTATYDATFTIKSNWYERDGYYFVGWNETSTATTGSDWDSWSGTWSGDWALSNKTLYAIWLPNTYKLTFNPNYGTLKNPGDNLYNTMHLNPATNAVRVTYDQNYYYLMTGDIPTRTGAYFKGWYINQTTNQQIYNSEGKANSYGGYFEGDNRVWKGLSDKEVVANWNNRTLTINYEANGGKWSDNSISKSSGALNYWDSVNTSDTKKTYQIGYCYTNSTGTNEAPKKSGYEFDGWGLSNNNYNVKYKSNENHTDNVCDIAKVLLDNNGIDNSSRTATLYAQWHRTIKHTFYYYNNKTAESSVTFYNNESSNKNMSIPSEVRQNKDNVGYNWSYRGITFDDKTSAAKASNATVTYGADITQISISPTTNNSTYFASYVRTVTTTFKSYGTDKNETRTVTSQSSDLKTYAYMNYIGTIKKAELKALTGETMNYTEKNAANNGVMETWNVKLGWTQGKSVDSQVTLNNGAKYETYKDEIYFQKYQKPVTLTTDANGGTINGQSNKTYTYTRMAIATDTLQTTSKSQLLSNPIWVNNGITVYDFITWTHTKLDPNQDLKNHLIKVNGFANTGSGTYRYTPLVTETIYAAWKNITDEPSVTISKKAEWYNKDGDNIAIDYDANDPNIEKIDIDGYVKVTVTVNVNATKAGVKDITINDYFDTNKWVMTNPSGKSASTGVVKISNGKLKMQPNNVAKGTSVPYVYTYYLQIKESFWDVTGNTDEYINAIADLTQYKASLDSNGNTKSSNTYYSTSQAAHDSYVWVKYTIADGDYVNIQRNIHNSTPKVIMRPVNWRPTVEPLKIESNTNNIYKNTDSNYGNAYFVKYDTKSNSNSSNSTYRITSNSSIRRSYPFYQITDNLLDMQASTKEQQVVDNYIGLNVERSETFRDKTSDYLSAGFTAKSLIPVSSVVNLHTVKKAPSSDDANQTLNITYPYGALTSVDTLYSTNRDGLGISIYPFATTTNTNVNPNKTFDTTRNTSELANKRLDVIIDASNPIITADKLIQTESSTYGKWTESDGYVDINLVDTATNPTAKTRILQFDFTDAISGIANPDSDNNDWVNSSNQNVQVTLKRVDNEPITIYDSANNATNSGNIVNVNYTSKSGINKNGNVKVTLDPNNNDLMGHLKLTIRVIDNVSNYTDKTYDLYVFCLTGDVQVSNTVADYDDRMLDSVLKNTIANGERGIVNIYADGYVDRVTAKYDSALNKLYKAELDKRLNISNDTGTTLDGDYPADDAKSLSGANISNSMTYLPYSYQKNRWSPTELGGIPLQTVDKESTNTTINNEILQDLFDTLVDRYQKALKNEKLERITDSNYVIIGTTLFVNPTYSGTNIASYVAKYELSGKHEYMGNVYPTTITVNDKTNIDLSYAENDTHTAYNATIPPTTIVASEWKNVSGSYYRPFTHSFYMPLYADVKSTPYTVRLVAYKDSEKTFKHSVTIDLTFYNASAEVLNGLQTNIRDN